MADWTVWDKKLWLIKPSCQGWNTSNMAKLWQPFGLRFRGSAVLNMRKHHSAVISYTVFEFKKGKHQHWCTRSTTVFSLTVENSFWVLCLKCCWQTERQHLLNRWKWASDGNQAVPSFSKDRDGTNVSFEIAPESSYEFLCKCSFLLAVSSLFIGHSKAKNVMKLVR